MLSVHSDIHHELRHQPGVELPALVVEDVEVADDRDMGELVPAAATEGFPILWQQPMRFVMRVVSTLFSFLSLILILAVLAAIPIVNVFVLGYFMNVEGRVARTGRFRDAFPLIDVATRIVTIVAGIWICLLPLRFLASFAADARLIDPGSAAGVNLHIAVNVGWWLISVHILLALARGGSLWCFVRPIKNFFWTWNQLNSGTYFATADAAISGFVAQLQVRRHFWLGIRGFAVAFLWLFFPTALYSIAREPEGIQILLTILGGFSLAIMLTWAPYLQARFAAEERFRGGLQLREVRQLYAHAPIACSLNLILLFALSLPLYLFKAFLLPPEVMWPVTLIFVATIYPTRILTGWVYHRAVRKREQGRKSHWSVRWLCSVLTVAVLGIYVFIVFFTQFLGEQGKLVLFHHHALLLPAPFQWTLNP